jgi:nickel superoxide dismutase
MKKEWLFFGIFSTLCLQGGLSAHCQMPCGIYHDDMIFDQIDQYVETMYKGMTMLTNSKFETPKERTEFVRWVMTKDSSSNDVSELLTTYFLQQKIKPDEEDTTKKLISAHKLLFLVVQIKQNTDRALIEKFNDEWEKFKLMFHVEGYSCKIEMLKERKRQEKLKQKNGAAADSTKKATDDDEEHDDDDHDHDDGLDHGHTH